MHLSEAASVVVLEEGDAVYLELDLPEALTAALAPVTTGADLGRVRIVDAEFENPDGTLVRADVDLVGTVKADGTTYPAGPLAEVAPGRTRVRVW